MLKILLDEGLARLAAEFFRQDSVDALHAQEAGLLSAADAELIEFARKEQRVIFTLDHDYHKLLALSGGRDPSVVLRCLSRDSVIFCFMDALALIYT